MFTRPTTPFEFRTTMAPDFQVKYHVAALNWFPGSELVRIESDTPFPADITRTESDVGVALLRSSSNQAPFLAESTRARILPKPESAIGSVAPNRKDRAMVPESARSIDRT